MEVDYILFMLMARF